MALPHVFATFSPGNFPAQDWDDNWNATAAMGVVQCTATGTNTVALTPVANMPTVSSYTNLQLFSFTPAANSTGNVQVNASTVGALNLYLPDGVTQAAANDLLTSTAYLIQYQSALNSSTGGFTIVSAMPKTFLLYKKAQTMSGGVRPVSFSGGTIGSAGSFTPDSGNGPLQFITNSGAAGGFTLAAPAQDGSLILLITNGASAGTITASGYTVSSNTGDALTTTNGNKFMLQIVAINSIATYIVKALQ